MIATEAVLMRRPSDAFPEPGEPAALTGLCGGERGEGAAHWVPCATGDATGTSPATPPVIAAVTPPDIGIGDRSDARRHAGPCCALAPCRRPSPAAGLSTSYALPNALHQPATFPLPGSLAGPLVKAATVADVGVRIKTGLVEATAEAIASSSMSTQRAASAATASASDALASAVDARASAVTVFAASATISAAGLFLSPSPLPSTLPPHMPPPSPPSRLP